MAAALGEILHNVAKHARATRVDVGLTGDADPGRLTVRDDGVGFERPRRPAARPPATSACAGCTSAPAQVGGDVDIESEPGKGTCVRWTATTTAAHSSTRDVPLRLPR